MAEECWVIGDQEQIKEELQVGLKVWREQIEHQLKGNTCPVCGQNLLFQWHTVDECLEDYVRNLMDTETQAVLKTEATWKIYEGNIKVTQNWKNPVLGLKACGFCKQKCPLHYPKECDRGGLVKACVHHPCLFCGKEDPGHLPMDCQKKNNASYKGDPDALFQQCIQFQQALAYQKIYHICCASEITDSHVESVSVHCCCWPVKDGLHLAFAWTW